MREKHKKPLIITLKRQVDELILAVAWEVIQPENNQELSEMAVNQTGLGNVEDKKRKNRRKTIGLLRDLKGCQNCRHY